MCLLERGVCRRDRCSTGTFGGRISDFRIGCRFLWGSWPILGRALRRSMRVLPNVLLESILKADVNCVTRVLYMKPHHIYTVPWSLLVFVVWIPLRTARRWRKSTGNWTWNSMFVRDLALLGPCHRLPHYGQEIGELHLFDSSLQSLVRILTLLAITILPVPQWLCSRLVNSSEAGDSRAHTV